MFLCFFVYSLNTPQFVTRAHWYLKLFNPREDFNELITCWIPLQNCPWNDYDPVCRIWEAAHGNVVWCWCSVWKRCLFHVLHFPPYDYFSREADWDFSAAEVIRRACCSALNTVSICNANDSRVNNPLLNTLASSCLSRGLCSPGKPLPAGAKSTNSIYHQGFFHTFFQQHKCGEAQLSKACYPEDKCSLFPRPVARKTLQLFA